MTFEEAVPETSSDGAYLDDQTRVLETIQGLLAAGFAKFCAGFHNDACLQLQTGEIFAIHDDGITRIW